MATTTTITKLLFRRGNDADRKKTILASGEPGFALDTGRFYIGDGSTPGGHPVIAVSDWHLNYVDEIGQIEGDYSRHALDISVPGLSATLAGDRREPEHLRYPKLFHPTDRILRTDFPLELTGQNDNNAFGQNGTHSILFSGPGSSPFIINRAEPGLFSVMDGIFTIETFGDGQPPAIKLGDGDATLALEAGTLQLVGGNETHIEDSTIDLNVPFTDVGGSFEVMTPAQATAVKSEDVGVYFAHSGYLSAGGIFIGRRETPTANTLSTNLSYNTINLKPTLYASDWVAQTANQSNMIERLALGKSSYGPDNPNTSGPLPRGATFLRGDVGTTSEANETSLWGGIKGPNNLANDGYHDHMGQHGQAAKPIQIQSVRPFGSAAEQAGNATNFTSSYQTATVGGVDEMIHANMAAPYYYPGINIKDRGQPNPWAGNVDLIFETGLVVYGPGDRDLQPDVNGYLINQSLDSYAIPTFQGLIIEGPNSKPMGVESGGTGRRKFNPGALLAGNGTTANDANGPNGSKYPLHEVRCPQMVGTNKIGILTGTPNSSFNAVVSAGMLMNPPQWWNLSSDTKYKGAANQDSMPTNNGSGVPGGTVTVTNNFAPNATSVGNGGWDQHTTEPKQMFFDKWTYITADTGSAQSPDRFDGTIDFQGDAENMVTTVSKNTTGMVSAKPSSGDQWSPGWGPTTRVNWTHTEHAEVGGLWSAPNTSGTADIKSVQARTNSRADGANLNALAAEPSGNGVVISKVTFNKAGHLRQIEFKDLDARYAKRTNMGGNTPRSGGRLQLPTKNNIAINTSSGILELSVNGYSSTSAWSSSINTNGATWARSWLRTSSSGPQGGLTCEAIDSIEFNDYGTVHNVISVNLNNTFFTKSQIADVMDNLADDFQDHEDKLNNWPLRRDINSTTSNTVTTTWNRGSTIGFASDSGNPDTTIQQSSGSSFNIKSTGGINIHTGAGSNYRLYRGSTSTPMIAADNDVTLYYNGDARLATSSSGLYMHGSGDPNSLGDSVKQIDGCSKYSVRSKYVMVSERETNAWHSMIFTSDGGQNSGYEYLYKDNAIQFNAGTNTLKTSYFQGDGRHLDMSKNTTIPPTVELETAGNAYYRVVGCTSNRHKIYDRDNTLKYHGTNGTVLAKGDIYAYYSFSDERLKDKITTLDPEQSLNKILELKPVSFEWKEAPERGKQMGLVAQQVEQVVPEVVHDADRYTEGDGPEDVYKRVDYDKLVPLLIDSIKVLTSRVEELESQLNNK